VYINEIRGRSRNCHRWCHRCGGPAVFTFQRTANSVGCYCRDRPVVGAFPQRCL